ncbi:hypothetical protein J8J27_24620, partial [Mycobacterium tuberculosis]|nr:hypothetical protein [Mycobacterium tuberculosis]
NLVVETPFGNARVAKLTLNESLNGVVQEGNFEFGLALGAIEPPAALMPSWANGLVPKQSALGVRVTGYNLENFVRAAVAKLDLKADKPLDMKDEEAAAAILPSGRLLLD